MKTLLSLALSTAFAVTLAGCSKTEPPKVAESVPETPTETVVTTEPSENNPFFDESPLYMNYPQFDKIENSHFVPALSWVWNSIWQKWKPLLARLKHLLWTTR